MNEIGNRPRIKKVALKRIVSKIIIVMSITSIYCSNSLAQQVISTQGTELRSNIGSLNFTIGEVVILTLRAPELTVTQGFQQTFGEVIDNEGMALAIKENLSQAVTPNGDGKNDEFIIKGIEEFPNNVVRIFDRWGSMIYEVKGYNNVNKVWRGQSRRGLMSSGEITSNTYFYTIHLSPGVKPISGFIHIKL